MEAQAAPKTTGSAKSANDRTKERFLELSGYEEEDIIGSNMKTRTFVTANGGKYEMNKSGKVLKVLAGPNPPDESSLLESAEEGGSET